MTPIHATRRIPAKRLDKTGAFNYHRVTMQPQNVEFFFENRRLEGIAGEPVAKALYRTGVRTLSHSVKFMRPRGVHCARGRCIMCHVEIDGVPGVPSCITPLEKGMRVRRENFRPFFAPLLVGAVRLLPFPAGFYYHFFTRPAFVRRAFLETLRRMAGVGRLVSNLETPPPIDATPLVNAARRSYDIVVVGAGLSGLAAAVSGARGGADVLLVDEYRRAGGHSLGHQADGELAAARDRLVRAASEHPSITFLPGTVAQGFYPPDTVLLGGTGVPRFRAAAGPRPETGDDRDLRAPHAMEQVRGRAFVFATGAYDVVPLFENCDLPGIFGTRAIRLLLERDGFRPGKAAAVFGTGSPLLETVGLLRSHDIEIVAVADAAPAGGGSGAFEPAPPIRHLREAKLIKAHGRNWISAVTFGPRSAHAAQRFANGRVICDMLCVALAGQGAYELPHQAGVQFELAGGGLEENRTLLPASSEIELDGAASCYLVGELAGQTHWKEKITAGELAGRRASATVKSH